MMSGESSFWVGVSIHESGTSKTFPATWVCPLHDRFGTERRISNSEAITDYQWKLLAQSRQLLRKISMLKACISSISSHGAESYHDVIPFPADLLTKTDISRQAYACKPFCILAAYCLPY